MPVSKAPWHHWPMAAFTLLFYVVGAVDYLCFKLGLGFYLKLFSDDQVSYFSSLPLWLNVVWAVGVWGGLLGAYLLWKRNRFSVLLLFVAFAALTILTAWLSFFFRPTLISVIGFMGLYVMVGTCALALLFYLYARWERAHSKL